MIKRSLDLFGAIFISLVMLVPFVCLCLLVRLAMGSPIFFIQPRAGLQGRPFKLVKFRTMKASDLALTDAERLTHFGRWLRSTSLDEIPSLFNVIKGDMSLVGPRPLLLEYLPLYSSWQVERLAVKPGLTGWAQVNGRNAISWKRKFLRDVWYVRNQSFCLDIKILLMTVYVVLGRKDISADNEATVSKFTGNN